VHPPAGLPEVRASAGSLFATEKHAMARGDQRFEYW
jgi:hypothetical protein